MTKNLKIFLIIIMINKNKKDNKISSFINICLTNQIAKKKIINLIFHIFIDLYYMLNSVF